ncbi:Ig-like domain-containing protein, partial [Serratia symbiotica]|uniref:Ig-like domain-containing protein n=1 Tax=Serratia symbiotica TaxID=138074 RepID=UPI00188738C5
DANSSTLTPRHSTLTADGKSSQLLTLVLKDMQGQPLEMPLADIHMAVSALKSAHVSAVTQKQAGVYQVTVTAGSEAENITLTPVLGNLTLGAAQVVISYSPPDGAHSKFVADRESITADGQDSATLTFTAQDANGNLIAGLSHVTFMLPDGTPTDKVNLNAVTDKGNGVYQATLRGTRAGSYKVTPQVNGKAVGNLNATVTLKAGQTPDGAHSKFVADRESITADGQDSATLTFTAQDANGNPLAGLSHVTFMLPDGTPTDKVNLSAVTDKGHGVYQATLRGTRAGSYKVTPQVNGKAVGNLNATVTLKAFVTAVQDIQVNGYEFAPTAGFPKTGFTRAYFTVRLNGGAAQDYNWSTSAPDWTAVSADGVVRFTDKGNANEVTITATAKNNPARVSRYAFKLSDWYIYNSTGMSWPDANSYCAKQSASLPTRLQLGGTATEGQNQ